MTDNSHPPVTKPPETAATRGFVTTCTTSVPKYRPFPLEMLPPSIGDYCRHLADVLNVDTAMTVIPMLSAIGGLIGNTRRIQISPDWSEPSVIWGAIVSRSGTLKSPAQRKAIACLYRLNEEVIAENQKQNEIYQIESRQYKDQLRVWSSGKSDLPEPVEPTPPVRKRYMAGDITMEALAAMLVDNPRGLTLVHDELAGFFAGLNQYKKGGSDEQHYLEMFNAGTICWDRKTDREQLFVRRAAVSILGTIQPRVLRRILSTERFESGMVARFLFAQPPERDRKRPTHSIPQEVKEEFAEVFFKLANWWEMKEDEDGNLSPDMLVMDSEASDRWWAFYETHSYRISNESDDDIRSALSKLEAYCARFALVIHCVLNCHNPGRRTVDVGTVEAAEEITKWFIDETLRVYAHLRESDHQRARRELIEHIQEKGGTITVRELQRGPRQFRSSGVAESLLEGLVNDEMACRQLSESVPAGGRPTYVYELKLLDW